MTAHAVLFCGLVLATSANAVEIEATILDAERDPSRREDPVDGLAKTHLTNRERDLRVFIGDDAVWAFEKRTDAAAFRGEIALGGFVSDELPVLGDDTVSLRSDTVTQVWTNTPRGVEHVFIVDEVEPSDELILDLNVTGLIARARGPSGVYFVDDAGVVVASYTQLAAFDDSARSLPARMDVSEDGKLISIRVDVDGAEWPVTVDPITSGEVTRQGVEADSSFGASVAVGYINNDAFADLIVGAPGFDSTSAQDDEGAVYWFLGSSSGIAASASDSREGCSSSCSPQYFGSAIALGDVNGSDGDDLVVAVPGASSAGNTNDGTIKIFLNNGSGGFASTPSATLNSDINGCIPGERGGLVVADVDDDGYDDVVARCAGTGLSENVLLWWGVPSTGPSGAADVSEDVFADLGTEGGYGLAVGRITGDDIPDIAVPGLAEVRIFPGDGISRITLDPTVDDRVDVDVGYTTDGELVAALVDVNGDMFDDLVIGDGDDGAANGYVAVFQNNGGAIELAVATDFSGPAESGTGDSIAGGDVNDDGYGDVLVCGALVDQGASDWVGKCDLYGGSASGLETSPSRLSEYGILEFELLGAFQGSAAFGDFSGDGAQDVVLGSSNFGLMGPDNRGQVRVYDGERSGLNSSSAGNPESNATEASMGSVIAVDDIDRDGYDDLIAGIPSYDNGDPSDGAVFLWRGGSGGSFNTTLDWSVLGSTASSLGESVTVGRFHGFAAAPSVAISEPGFNAGEGRILIFQAGASTLPSGDDPSEATQSVPGDDVADTDERFGDSIVACGRLINTSGDCLAVGAPAKSGTSSTGGSVYVFSSSGSGGLATGAPAASRSGTDNGTAVDCTDEFAETVANAGNVDDADAASPRDDLLVGAGDCDNGSANEGKVFLYTGASGGVLVASGFTFESNQAGARAGQVVVGLGDVSGDAIADFAVSAPYYDASVANSGRVWVFLGSNGTPSTTPVFTWSSTSASRSGWAVSGGSDVNRDGFMDLVVGEPYLSNGHTNEGRYCVFFGGSGGPDTTSDYCREGGGTSYNVGNGAGMGDFNGDGYGDIVVGAPGYDNTQTDEGRLTIVFGQW